MRKLSGIVAFAALIATPALAADLGPMYTKAPPPLPAAYNWGGFYVGVNAGGHWGRDSDPAFVSDPTNASGFALTRFAVDLPVTLNPTGFAGGAQLGYNWQWSRLVLGVEADFDGLSGSSTRILNDPLIPSTNVDSATDRWMATARVRAGYALDRVLFYVTGGAALSNWATSHSWSTTPGFGAPVGAVNSTFTRSGWTAGLGLEYAVTSHWLGRIEYLYADFGTANSTLVTTVPTRPGFASFSFAEPEKLTEQVLRVGASYKFR